MPNVHSGRLGFESSDSIILSLDDLPMTAVSNPDVGPDKTTPSNFAAPSSSNSSAPMIRCLGLRPCGQRIARARSRHDWIRTVLVRLPHPNRLRLGPQNSIPIGEYPKEVVSPLSCGLDCLGPPGIRARIRSPSICMDRYLGPEATPDIANQNIVVTDYPRQADVRAGRTRCWQQAGN